MKHTLFLLLIMTGPLMAKKNLQEIDQNLKTAQEQIQPGQKYYHYKTPTTHYTITGISTNVHTEEPMIHYTDGIHDWSRDFVDFISCVQVQGEEIKKFQPVKG